MPNMLPLLPPTLRRTPGRPIKVTRKESDEPQTIKRPTKKGVEMRCNKCNKLGHKEEFQRSKDIKLVFITKWLLQLNKRIPQLNKRLPQLSRKLPQLINKLPQLMFMELTKNLAKASAHTN
ncbi:hypothetical protein GOBAR_AA17702 [Gossypium barbadense]|uniref:Uncharacterized protein n=1 Tax=Gossypium barbadense TaxID=3634 RepID=A0A2P5XI38_GOSBA|nr:hypothetical protein GOBAR_AA17702 [Gossypium barbadense]